MMFNDSFAGGSEENHNRPRSGKAGKHFSDKEVPLGDISKSVHAWLDGAMPEREARNGEWAHDVDFWKRIDNDLENHRRRRTPAGLNARIMSAIPMHAPAIITPWWRREFVITPGSAMMLLIASMAAASAATAMILK